MQFFHIDCQRCTISREYHGISYLLFVFSVEIRPENEYDRLMRLSNEYLEEIPNDSRPCGGFSLHYECACDFYQIPCHRSVLNVSFIFPRIRFNNIYRLVDRISLSYQEVIRMEFFPRSFAFSKNWNSM